MRLSIILVLLSLLTPWYIAEGRRPISADTMESGSATIRQDVQAPKPKPKGKGADEQAEDVSKRPPMAENTERIRAFALELLKSLPEKARSLEDVRDRASLLSSVAELLWKHDETLARTILSDSLDDLLKRLNSELNASEKRASTVTGLESAIKTVLRVLARKDARMADLALERYQKVRDTGTDEKASSVAALSERLSLAADTIDVSVNQSVSLARRTLPYAVPSAFPQYLYDLSKVDKAAADGLYREALQFLASSSLYTPGQAIYLSVYPFREHWIVQLSAVTNEKRQVEFGTFTGSLSAPEGDLDRNLQQEYMSAAYAFLTAAIPTLAGSLKPDPLNIGRYLFLARKLNLYGAKYGLDPQGNWAIMEKHLESLARSGGMDISIFDGPKGFAERLVANEALFQFDQGASAFAKAAAAQDPQARVAFQAEGIRVLLDQGKFKEAEQRLTEVKDNLAREQLKDVVNFRAGQHCIADLNWSETDLRVRNLTNPNMKVFLLLDGARAAAEKDRDRAAGFMTDALAIIPKIDDLAYQAKASVAAVSITLLWAPSWGKELLVQAKTAINKASDYDGQDLHLEYKAPGLSFSATLEKSGLDYCFSRVTRDDWFGTISIIAAINSSKLRLVAELAACRSIL